MTARKKKVALPSSAMRDLRCFGFTDLHKDRASPSCDPWKTSGVSWEGCLLGFLLPIAGTILGIPSCCPSR